MVQQTKKQMGRPIKPAEEKLEQRSIRLLPRQWAKIDAAGIDWFRKAIDRLRPPKGD